MSCPANFAIFRASLRKFRIPCSYMERREVLQVTFFVCPDALSATCMGKYSLMAIFLCSLRSVPS